MANQKPSFKFDASDLMNGFLKLEDKAGAAMLMYAENGALKLQNSAKQNRPWTDRTGHARQRLTGKVNMKPNGYELELAHGVDYGIWLELAHEKRFAIIEPTINKEGPRIVQGFERLLDKL